MIERLCNIASAHLVFAPTLTEVQKYTLYPNPNNGSFTLASLNGVNQSELVSIKVYNTLGQQIYQTNTTFINGIMNLNLAKQMQGVYLLCIDDASNKTTCLRFVIK